MKRAFQASLRVIRRPLESFGLTAARFDMLWCIHQADTGEDEYPVYQSHVRKKLGVTAATVTRMMKSLEALGLVRRERDIFDRRQIVVSLTREGLDRVRAVYSQFVQRQAAERLIVGAVLGGPFDNRWLEGRSFAERQLAEWRRKERSFAERSADEGPIGGLRSDEQTASDAMGRLGELLDRIRKGFRDRGRLHYERVCDDPHPWLMRCYGAGIRDSL
jgi:DNA-binding MarR family transcriptional regulator